jgi:hypothetical protein
VPTWLQEGVACTLEGGPTTYEVALAALRRSKQYLTADQLAGGWQGLNADQARTAYVQSRSMVEMLLAGADGSVSQDASTVMLILDDMRRGFPFDAAFRRNVRVGTKHLTPAQFIQEWAKQQR